MSDVLRARRYSVNKNFEQYWNNYGELHASMCNGDIKQFAQEIWESAISKQPKRNPLPDGTLPLTEEELKEFSNIVCLDGVYNVNCVGCHIYINSEYWDNLIVNNYKAILWLANLFDLEV